MLKILSSIKESCKLGAKENAYITLDSIALEEKNVTIKYLNQNKEAMYLDVSNIILSIVEDEDKLTQENMQKLYRELPKYIDLEKNSSGKYFLNKYLVYRMIYKACSLINLTNNEIYFTTR